MTPDAIDTPSDRWSFPWWLFGILVSSPVSIAVGFVVAVVLVWQRKRLQLWAWQLRGRFR
jgi:NhaP-type Na+/H+ or K+/H+ antiporter